jgi:hypothetical protein
LAHYCWLSAPSLSGRESNAEQKGEAMKLHQASCLGIVWVAFSTAALAASLIQTATLKDLQTVGTTSKKQKHQQYDLLIDTPTNEYVCRTKLGSSLKPIQFVVGSTLQFKLNGQSGEATNSSGNHTKCSIVRVAAIPPPQ